VALAGLYLDADELDEATRILREAGDAFPDDPGVFFQLGAVFERQQRYGEAEQAFLRVLSTNPEHAPALNYLGYMLAERGERLEASVGYVQRALELDPANGSYLDSLGWAFFKMNRLEEASVQLARASDQLQTNSVVQDHLAQVLFALERYEEAIAAWERALAGDGESIDRRDVEQRIQSAREKVR
jgi:tetratricopeptide (TPR) repeat protein